VPTLRDIVYSFCDENPQNIPTPNIVNQRIGELRKSDEFREYRRKSMGPQTEMEQFYRDLAVRHQNLIQEWERLYTPEGRLRLIEDLQTLENSIVGLINRYNTNTERNIKTLYATLPLNQHFIEYLMQSFEIYQIRGQWEQTLGNGTDIPPVLTEPETQSKPKTTTVTVAEESEETSVEVPSLLDICLSFSLKTRIQIPVPNENMSDIDIWRLVENLRSLLREIIEMTDYYYLGSILYPISPDIIRNLNENNIEINYELIEHLIQRCREINRIINKWKHITSNPHSEQLSQYMRIRTPERQPSVSPEPQQSFDSSTMKIENVRKDPNESLGYHPDIDLVQGSEYGIDRKTPFDNSLSQIIKFSGEEQRKDEILSLNIFDDFEGGETSIEPKDFGIEDFETMLLDLPPHQPLSSDQVQPSDQISGNEIIYDEIVEDLINYSPTPLNEKCL
jgi:hypothetical protein